MHLVLYVLLISLATIGPKCCFGQQSSVRYSSSDNGKYVARIQSGDSESPATAIVFQVSMQDFGMDSLAHIVLPNAFLPLETIITDDGRHVVNLGNYTGGTDLSAAVSIYDLESSSEKVFSFLDIFKDRVVDDVTAGGVRYQFWFQHEFHIDEQKKTVYLTGYNNRDPANPPTIVVDYGNATTLIDETNFWKAKFDALALQTEQTQEDAYTLLSVEQSHLLDRILETKSAPAVEYLGVGNDFLFRLQPGSAEDTAKVLMYKFDLKKQSFDLLKSIPLKNPIAPSENYWTVSPDARYMITYDEIDSVGVTDNAIVIYDLEKGRSRAFSLEDFCSQSDLDQMAHAKNVRMWRLSRPWIFLSDKQYKNWPPRANLDSSGLVPQVIVDLEKLNVRLAEPFVSKFRR